MDMTSRVFHLIAYFALCFLLVQAKKGKIPRSSIKKVLVDISGHGDYVRIQDAINAVPSGNSRRVYITVRPGVYKEKIVVSKDKRYITLSGVNENNTIVTWSDGGDIYQSPTFTVFAPDFVARRLTIENKHGRGEKSVALRVSADRVAFYACRILGYQDTLLDDRGRHYYKNCLIEGATDFICGNGASTFEKCHLHSVSSGKGAITAHHRTSPSEDTGFTFVNCTITGGKMALLGRPWGPYARVIFAKTYMSGGISPQGWGDWGEPSRQRTAYFGEFANYGPGAKTSGRVSWTKTLSRNQVEPYLRLEKRFNWLKKSDAE
ncbi:hypothetical protein Leryth_014594 [Lithospermum erythrorhizon]|uniref:pectinesterase n=1 Tax=Lithospermum erythrorhizon TaxID=34254 RepID=A0AAV3QDX9_LITER|nr:hypothetical protein Leryth_014594 [Lithospermum erythrorhizon]